jgi:hypothetical protein
MQIASLLQKGELIIKNNQAIILGIGKKFKKNACPAFDINGMLKL